MEKVKICKFCGSSDIRVSTYIEIDAPFNVIAEQIDKKVLMNNKLEVLDSYRPLTVTYCNSCKKNIDISGGIELIKTEYLKEELDRRNSLNESSSSKINDIEYDLAHGGIKWEGNERNAGVANKKGEIHFLD